MKLRVVALLVTLLVLACCCTALRRVEQKGGGAFGVDISLQTCESGVSIDTWKCLVNQGFSFAIIEAWNGGYQFNKNISKCVNDAWSVGMRHVDVYAFMCPNCRGNNPPQTAVDTLVEGLSNVRFGQLWFDIEQCDGCWNDYASNVNYVQQLVNRGVAHLGSSRVGLYSSSYEWQITMGGSKDFSHLPLWYAHYDNDPSFSDRWAFTFGGWSQPSIKQYNDHGSGCSINADIDWYPV